MKTKTRRIAVGWEESRPMPEKKRRKIARQILETECERLNWALGKVAKKRFQKIDSIAENIHEYEMEIQVRTM